MILAFEKHPFRAAVDVPRNRSTTDPRRIAAAKRHLATRREREGLFASTDTSDEAAVARLTRFTVAEEERIAEDRARRAAAWRRARAALRALPEGTRVQLLHRWNESRGPKSPEYLLSRIFETCHPEAVAIVAAGWELRDMYRTVSLAPHIVAIVERLRAVGGAS